jgi:lipid A 4'-phosphatase
MNRTGLFIALSLALVIGVVFGVYPDLDLKLAALFFDPESRTFPLKANAWAAFAREAAMWVTWAMVIPGLGALVLKIVRQDRPLLISGRAIIFLIATLVVSSVVLSNLAFKSHWGRPRPVAVAEFNTGQFDRLEFVPWWDPRGGCAWNCSFFSGEGAAAFWTYAPAALAPPALRPLAYVAATAFGLATGVLRMAFGGHFFTDIAAAGIVTFLVIWLFHGFIYRWPRTRLTDEAIDAALTRPGFRSQHRPQVEQE